jgi:signal peptidase II
MPDQSKNTHSTIRSKRAWAWLLITITLGIVTDLVSKSLAFAHITELPVYINREQVLAEPNLGNLIPYHDAVVVIPKILEFTLVLNPGAVFGIGAGQRWFFIIFTLFAITVALLLFAKWTKPKDWTAHAGFGLIISGGIGNLYDRLVFGCVRDFIHPLPGMKLPFGLTWPGGGSDEVWPYVSNIADLYLLIGIGLLLIYTWTQPDPKAIASKETKSNIDDSVASDG